MVSSVASVSAHAQCSDGSPPPCRAQQVAVAPKRVNPPLDERTWIVVPFDNLARNQEVDWLRGASVNLLYLDMSRWRDIRVIDDERVSDLIREIPEAGGTHPLSLNAGLAIAKRAGAGRLVMGDLLKLGNRTAVTAKVYDVRNGQRVRSVREETAVQDSIMPLFGKLARRILNVAPPEGATLGAHGTSRVDAYQEYIAGVAALNHFDVIEARQRLERALALDSTFALAHYKMSIVVGWDDGGDRAGIRSHAEAAGRLSANLPSRERALIAGQLWHARGDEGRACQEYAELIRADSSDVEAWYGLGECSYHDGIVEAVGGDTTNMRFRGSWARSIRAFERVLELDPTYHLAYQHIVDILTTERHWSGCYRPDPTSRCVQYGSFVLLSGDSVVRTAVATRDSAAVRAQAQRYVATNSRRRNLQLAASAAQAWAQASPSDARARGALGRALVFQGRVAEAGPELAAVKGPLSLQTFLNLLVLRMEVAYKNGQAGEAIRLYDSVRTHHIPLPGSNPPTLGSAIAGWGAAFGRIVEQDSALVARMRGREPDWLIRYQQAAMRGVIGASTDSLAALETAAFDQLSATRGATVAAAGVAGSLMYALRLSRARWPPIDTATRSVKLRPAVALARGDTAGVRASARVLDSLLSTVIVSGGADSGFAMIAAEAYLAIRDSAAALTTLRRALDSAMATTIMFPVNSDGMPVVYVYPRMMLLRADLAAARSHRDEARTWYKRFIDVWSTAAPELQSIVERARKAHAALGS
jgi:tetratricopeptide (TPR) repeat protein/TolB-like protein